MIKSLLHHALNRARLMLPHHPQYDNFPHWSFVVMRNQIISYGMNRKHEPPVFIGYHNHGTDPTFIPKLHSEVDALKNLYIPTFEIINIRLNKRGEMRMSYPCKRCFRLLKDMNCKKVYYTTNYGWDRINLQKEEYAYCR